MKKFLITLLCTWIVQISLCQSIDDLDKKRGFKEFTLGDTYSKWQNSLEYDTTENATAIYKVRGIMVAYSIVMIFTLFT